MSETRKKPKTITQCPTLFGKWSGIFYMPSHTDTAGHTKAFDAEEADEVASSETMKSCYIGVLELFVESQHIPGIGAF